MIDRMKHLLFSINNQVSSGKQCDMDNDTPNLIDEDSMEGKCKCKETKSSEDKMMEYKEDFLNMSVGSIRAIMNHAKNIIDSLENPQTRENLTESWLQGKIAIAEDYMRTIHDFVMFVKEEDDISEAGKKPGLWDNIRKKKEKMGKNYKPSKPGDKDRPDPDQWKKLTK